MKPGDEKYEAAVRATAAALPAITQDTRDRLTLLLRGARPPQTVRRTA